MVNTQSAITFPQGTPDVLQKICERTMSDLLERMEKTSIEELKSALKDAEKPRGFLNSLEKSANGNKPALIAEIKKASPSKGLIRDNFKPEELAKAYFRGGADCLSVLTDTPFFQGHPDYLKTAKNACPLPVLRKDFMLDKYQVYEARCWGADCILLIVAALEDKNMYDLYTLAKDLGMDVLIEVHNENELTRALVLNPEMIGVNNRDLKTLEVSIETSHRLAKLIPDTCLKIAESGINSHDDILQLQQSGFDAFLVGESLMRQENVEHATKTLLNAL